MKNTNEINTLGWRMAIPGGRREMKGFRMLRRKVQGNRPVWRQWVALCVQTFSGVV